MTDTNTNPKNTMHKNKQRKQDNAPKHRECEWCGKRVGLVAKTNYPHGKKSRGVTHYRSRVHICRGRAE